MGCRVVTRGLAGAFLLVASVVALKVSAQAAPDTEAVHEELRNLRAAVLDA
jgi:hypothetical protein